MKFSEEETYSFNFEFNYESGIGFQIVVISIIFLLLVFIFRKLINLFGKDVGFLMSQYGEGYPTATVIAVLIMLIIYYTL